MAMDNFLRETPEQSASPWLERLQQPSSELPQPDHGQLTHGQLPQSNESPGIGGHPRTPSLDYDGSSLQDVSPPWIYMSRDTSEHDSQSDYARPRSSASYAHSYVPDGIQQIEHKPPRIGNSGFCTNPIGGSAPRETSRYQSNYQPEVWVEQQYLRRRQAAPQYVQQSHFAPRPSFPKLETRHRASPSTLGPELLTNKTEALITTANDTKHVYYSSTSNPVACWSEAQEEPAAGLNVRQVPVFRISGSVQGYAEPLDRPVTAASSSGNYPTNTENLSFAIEDMPSKSNSYLQIPSGAGSTSRCRSILSSSGGANVDSRWRTNSTSQNRMPWKDVEDQVSSDTRGPWPSLIGIDNKTPFPNEGLDITPTDSDIWGARPSHSLIRERQRGPGTGLQCNSDTVPHTRREVEVHQEQHAQSSHQTIDAPHLPSRRNNPLRSRVRARAGNSDGYRPQSTFPPSSGPGSSFAQPGQQTQRQPRNHGRQDMTIAARLAPRHAQSSDRK
ncbi:MAG: hypothetical protein M1835_004311 [Candelina submexicana]|nr:MAG: hypothetical protein M1835_004311 [Candelina submexicana]